MAVQLVLRRPIPTPSAQLRVVWQGFREGDQAQALWFDASGETRRWPATASRWIQRDGLRQGEEWKVNLPGVPADVHRIVLQIVTSVGRTVGVAVQPLTGTIDDGVLHPGAELTANQPQDLIEFTRSGAGWLVAALNTAVLDEAGHQAAPVGPQPATPPAPGWEQPTTQLPTEWGRPAAPDSWAPAGASTDNPPERPPVPTQTWAPPAGPPPAHLTPPGPPPVQTQPPAYLPAPQSTPQNWNPPPAAQAPAPRHSAAPAHQAAGSDGFGPQVQIPTRLESAVDAARASGNTRRRSVVGALVDTSASMRPWIASGQLADVLTAVQAVAGASNRPSVAARFLPADQEVELALGTEPAELLRSQLSANGLRTGDRSGLLAAAGRAAGRGGLQLLVTDDSSLVADAAVTVLLGPNPGAAGFAAVGAGQSAVVVAVPPGPVDIRRLARDLANASAAL